MRYNVTEQLQFAVGGNNIFNIRPDVQGFAGPPPDSPMATTSPAVSVPAGNGSVQNNFFGAAWNPNGGYYYGRINFNF